MIHGKLKLNDKIKKKIYTKKSRTKIKNQKNKN